MVDRNYLRARFGAELYDDLVAFNKQLQDPTTTIGRLVSRESIRASAEHIERAEIAAIVNTGNGVYIGDDTLVKKMLFPIKSRIKSIV